MSRREYLVYTDGSAKGGSDAPGGWGFVIEPPGGAAIEAYGRAKRTLAKVMEYQAVAEAIAALPHGATATVFSDNRSLVENLEKRLRDWRASDFVNVDPLVKESVRRIADEIRDKCLSVRFSWVRGHAGNARNERADALAAQGAREAKAEMSRRR